MEAVEQLVEQRHLTRVLAEPVVIVEGGGLGALEEVGMVCTFAQLHQHVEHACAVVGATHCVEHVDVLGEDVGVPPALVGEGKGQGVRARGTCKGYVQGVRARGTGKGYGQGVRARGMGKGYGQGAKGWERGSRRARWRGQRREGSVVC